MNFRNLTPHAIRIRLDASNQASPLESDIVIEPEKTPLRIQEMQSTSEWLADEARNIHVRFVILGEIEGLPEEEENVLLVASMPVAERAHSLGRRDVVSPDTGPDAIRFKLPNGNEGIYAVRALRYIISGE